MESKYGSSTLNPNTKDGHQMSDDWIKGSDRLEKIVDKEKALEIKEALDRGQVDRVLSKIDVNGNVTTHKLDKLGNIIGKW